MIRFENSCPTCYRPADDAARRKMTVWVIHGGGCETYGIFGSYDLAKAAKAKLDDRITSITKFNLNEVGDMIERSRARERNLRIRLEELRWVDQQILYPSEVEPQLSERIRQYERDLALAQEYGD